jgi:RNA polymerase sigma-70 factor, ECF subfamily
LPRETQRMQELVLIQPIRTARQEWAREAANTARRREFEAQLGECGVLAFRVARGVLRNTADAEDVAQEALLRAYRKFGQLREPQRLRGWLVRVAFRLALDRARSAKRRENRETLWAVQPVQLSAPPTAEDLAASREFQAHFDRAMDTLPDKLRLVLLLSAMEGQSLEQIAAELGIPVGTVKSRLFIARKKLSEKLRCYVSRTNKR